MLNNLRFGVEIETVSRLQPFEVALNLQRALPCFLFSHEFSPTKYTAPDVWGVGYDTSLSPKRHEYPSEVRSPVLPLSEIDKVVLVVRQLQNYCRTTGTCGIHVHVSIADSYVFPRPMPFIVGDSEHYRRVCVEARKLNFHKMTAKSRKEYANWKLNSDEHHSAIQRRGNARFEFRVFNGSLSVRHICRAIKLSMKAYSNALETEAPALT